MSAGTDAIASDAPGTEAVFQAIKGFLQSNSAGVFAGPIEMDTPLLNSGLDSLAILQLMMFLGEQLGMEVEEDDFKEENFATVGALVGRVIAKRTAA